MISLEWFRFHMRTRCVMRLKCVSVVIRRGELRWFGHLDGMENGSGMKREGNYKCKVVRGRPKNM